MWYYHIQSSSLLLCGNWTTYKCLLYHSSSVCNIHITNQQISTSCTHKQLTCTPFSSSFTWTLLTVHLWKAIYCFTHKMHHSTVELFWFTARSFKHISIIKTSPINSHINSVHNSTISVCYCVPTIGHILYLLKEDLKQSQSASPTLASLSVP